MNFKCSKTRMRPQSDWHVNLVMRCLIDEADDEPRGRGTRVSRATDKPISVAFARHFDS